MNRLRIVLLKILHKKEQEQSVISASDARKRYSETVKNIRNNPDTWHRIKGSIEE